MNQKKALIGLSLAVVVIAAVIVWDQKHTKKQELAEKTDKLVFDIDKDDIQQITLNHEKANATLVKKADRWFVATPSYYPADEAVVDQLINALKNLKYMYQISSEKSAWPKYEISNDSMIQLKTSGDETFTINLGAKAQTGYALYAGIGETGEVITTGFGLKAQIERSEFDLRSKHLTVISLEDLKELTYRSPEPLTLKFSKNGDEYKITSPRDLPADDIAVTNFIADLASMRASEIKDMPKEGFVQKFKNSPAFYEVSWKTLDDSEHRMEFSIFDGQLWGTDSQQNVYLKLNKEHDQKKLRRSLYDFRHKTVLEPVFANAKSVQFHAKQVPLNSDDAKQIAANLGREEATEFITKLPGNVDTSKSEFDVKVIQGDGSKTDLTIWKVGDDAIVKISDSRELVRFPPNLLTSFVALRDLGPDKS